MNFCEICETEHASDQPHRLSERYKISFFLDYGRWPTWDDAEAHCTPEVRAAERAKFAPVEITNQIVEILPS